MDRTQPTPRQLRMIALCARGYSREEIGRELIVSPWTVKMDLDALRGEIGARNLPHAITICVGLGLLRIEGKACVPAGNGGVAVAA